MRTAILDDMPAIAALRDSVGWTAHEWALRAVLDRPEARCFVAVEPGGSVVAVGSGISYGALGFVGNMVVDERHRRRGIGSAILDVVVGFLEERGSSRLELFATPEGRPLYAHHGFSPTDPSAMVSVPRAVGLELDPALRVEAAETVADLAAYDAPRFGGDRRGLLEMMAADAERPLLTARRGGELVGYLWLRADGPRIGPFVADSPEIASTLLADAFERVPHAEELSLNLPTSNVPGSAWLDGLGVALDPWDGRMGRGPDIERRNDTIYANLVGALG